MKRLCLLSIGVLALLGFCAVDAFAQSRPEWRVQRAFIKIVPAPFRDALTPVSQGDVYITYKDGRTVRVTRDGKNTGAAGDWGKRDNHPPQIGADGLTVGWTRGRYEKNTGSSSGGTIFLNHELVLHRNGKILRVLKLPPTFIQNWRFVNGVSQIATQSMGTHGPRYLRLWDVQSGKLLMYMMDFEAQEKSVPWAKRADGTWLWD